MLLSSVILKLLLLNVIGDNLKLKDNELIISTLVLEMAL